MEPRITVLTLGVDDLGRAAAFYRDGLGWPGGDIVGTEFPDGAVAFFQLSGGLTLALWPRASLARDAGLDVSPRAPTGLSIGHNVGSADEVDRLFARALGAGATAIRPPHETFWGGYSAYIQDPEGHLWELVFNPAMV